MAEFEIGGHQYSAERLTPKQQFHVNRRLFPVIAGYSGTFVALIKKRMALGSDASISNLLDKDLASILGPLAEGIAKLPETDADYIIDTCLSVVRRRDGNGWARLTAGSGQLMYNDVQWLDMIAIVGRVINDNLGNFTAGDPVSST